MPFAEYTDFQDCINKNQDKKDPKAYCATIQQQVEGKSHARYSFLTDQVAYETVETKGDKKYFITGYISTGEKDLLNDVVTPKGMQSMLKQIRESTIMLDYDHEAWRDSPTILPVGKIVQAKIDDRGLWIKAELNPHSPKFKDMWNSIKDGFIKAFSIAFKPVKTVMKVMGDTRVRLLEDLKLLNVALTGVPVNQDATIDNYGMKSIMLKAINDVGELEIDNDIELKQRPPKAWMDRCTARVGGTARDPGALCAWIWREKKSLNLEVKQMANENAKEDVEAKQEAPAKEEEMEESKDYKRGYKAGRQAGREEMKQKNDEEMKQYRRAGEGLRKEERKADEKEEMKIHDKEHEEKSEVYENLLAELKSLTEKVEAQESELKSLKEEGVFKSQTAEAPELKAQENVSILGMIQ